MKRKCNIECPQCHKGMVVTQSYIEPITVTSMNLKRPISIRGHNIELSLYCEPCSLTLDAYITKEGEDSKEFLEGLFKDVEEDE